MLLCRKKILECKRMPNYQVGFVDPDRVHVHNLEQFPEETENNLFNALEQQNYKDVISFPYNFR